MLPYHNLAISQTAVKSLALVHAATVKHKCRKLNGTNLVMAPDM